MSQLAIVQEFAEKSKRAARLDELSNMLEAIAGELGFNYFALVQHVDIRRSDNRSTIWLENYPEHWAEVFVASGLYANDPIHIASQRTSAGFVWSEVGGLIKLNAHHKRVLTAASGEGMGDGFTVPAHLPGESNGTCSFGVAKGRDLPRDNLMAAQLVGTFAFEAGRRIVSRQSTDAVAERPKLTDRQLQCLVFVAKGKTDWEIAQMLGIKETTVRDYIEGACRRYDVRRRVQLVLRALHDGQLTLRDAIG